MAVLQWFLNFHVTIRLSTRHFALCELQHESAFHELLNALFQGIRGPAKCGRHLDGIVGRRVERAPAVVVFHLIERRFEKTGGKSFSRFPIVMQSMCEKMITVDRGRGCSRVRSIPRNLDGWWPMGDAK